MLCSITALYARRKAWLKDYPKPQALTNFLLCGELTDEKKKIEKMQIGRRKRMG